MNTTDLSGKTALVTGSTSGIGLAIATRLASAGATVILHGLGSEAAISVARDAVKDASGRAQPVHFAADLRRPGEIETMMDKVHEQFGALDILVNNGGFQHVDNIVDFPVNQWDDMLAVNLSASFHTMRLAIPHMTSREYGRIVNIASISGLRGRAGKPAYNATKHGLIGLTKSVALELAPTNITCNAICPGWVDTPLVQRQVAARAERTGEDIETATRNLISLRQPSGRFVRPDQVAGLCLFLCSDDATEVRGSAYVMDGATTAA